MNSNKKSSCGCQEFNKIKHGTHQVSHFDGLRYIDTPAGKIQVVSTNLGFADKLGFLKMRWGIHRMGYKIEPGLYAVGNPTSESIVLVSSNYKMSFDRLRAELIGIDAWIMVIDTKGINVWCSAGKGTFGTEEIIERIKEVQLDKVVSHRKIILPQLGAPGVKAHEVKKQSGFRIIYGPIRAKDIKAFLASGLKATKDMRMVTFNLKERAALIPIEFVTSLKYMMLIALFFLIRGGFGEDGFSLSNILNRGLLDTMQFILIMIVLFALNPILLPWLPGKALSVKGVWVGLIVDMIRELVLFSLFGSPKSWLEVFGLFCIILSASSFIAMNFTGATTYTSLSGVKKEMRIAVPLQLIFFVIGIFLIIAESFI
jgi:hypothetical protein